MQWNESLVGLLTALGIGLLIGTVRERLHKPGVMKACARTHAIMALLGAITFMLGMYAFVVALLIVAVLTPSVVSKIRLTYLSGRKAYGHRVTSGLVALLAAALVTMNLVP